MTRLAPKPSTIHKLLALSGGVCAMPGCGRSLIQDGVFNATLAHIEAASENGPRYNKNMTDEQRRAFENLVYMCPNDGALIDKSQLVEKYTVAWLAKIKSEHEARHIKHPYIVEAQILTEALEEVQLHMEQTNFIYGDGNIQTNNQIYIHGENVADIAAQFVREAQSAGHEKEHTSTPRDNEDVEPGDTNNNPDDQSSGGTGGDEGTLTTVDAPGTIDSIAALETLMPEWTQTVNDINTEITTVGEYTTKAGEILEAQNRRGNQDASSKIRIFKLLAQNLTSPAKRIEDLSLQFMVQLQAIDPGIRVLIDINAENARNNPESLEQAKEFFNSIEELSVSSEAGLSSLEGLLLNIQPVEKMSNDLRIPLRRMRDGLELILEGRKITRHWKVLIEDIMSSLVLE